jgi:hypothetical protein
MANFPFTCASARLVCSVLISPALARCWQLARMATVGKTKRNSNMKHRERPRSRSIELFVWWWSGSQHRSIGPSLVHGFLPWKRRSGTFVRRARGIERTGRPTDHLLWPAGRFAVRRFPMIAPSIERIKQQPVDRVIVCVADLRSSRRKRWKWPNLKKSAHSNLIILSNKK